MSGRRSLSLSALAAIRPQGYTVGSEPAARPRFLSEADCKDLLQRLTRVTHGGGNTMVMIQSSWTGNVRWARNQVSTSGEVRNNYVEVTRNLNGAENGYLLFNDTSDAGLEGAARRAEALAQRDREQPQSDLIARYQPELLTAPKLFSEMTYQLDADKRAEAAWQLAQSAADAGMLSAGYIEVSAHSLAVLDTLGKMWYFPYTQAQYSLTVRDPEGTGSGWAGVDSYDWATIDGAKLSQIALDKCLKSRNPVAVEPGRYTTILEPQAVGDFVGPLLRGNALDRLSAERLRYFTPSPFEKTPPPDDGVPGDSKLGDRVIDERITISADPLDPELGFAPFDLWYSNTGHNSLAFAHPVYHAATWIDHGLLTNLFYDRGYAAEWLGRDTGLPNSGAFRMSVTGTTSSIEEMITTTSRGLLVTRFDQVRLLDSRSQLFRGHSRDGLWLIEKGKISKPIKNLTFTESILGALNNVEQLGVPQRVFNPPASALIAHWQPAIVPALKIRDFSFTALDDAV